MPQPRPDCASLATAATATTIASALAGAVRGALVAPPFIRAPVMAPFTMALAVAVPLAGCAPDSVRNFEAKGFNHYVDKVQNVCADTTLGTHNVGEWLRTGSDDSDDQYVYWLDQTSRLYYQRISVPEYRASIAGAMGGDKTNADALDCIVRQLPADRPYRPTGSLL